MAACGRTAVLSERNGPLDARVLFVAEAPGRSGADRTRIPMCGDRTGANFARLLAEAGLRREAVFVTNAVLCNPRDDQGRNARPTAGEVRTCSRFLAETIYLLRPLVIVTLGRTALAALNLIAPHRLALASSAARRHSWRGMALFPLYHPSGQVLAARRPWEQQARDYRALGRLLKEALPRLRTETTTSGSPEEPPFRHCEPALAGVAISVRPNGDSYLSQRL